MDGGLLGTPNLGAGADPDRSTHRVAPTPWRDHASRRRLRDDRAVTDLQLCRSDGLLSRL